MSGDLAPFVRQSAYAAIDSEREYQDRRWASQQINVPSIDAYAVYVAGYTAKLVEACSTTDDVTVRLDLFRKIAGLCVACMEQYGAPKR